jgi:hypothetical protein
MEYVSHITAELPSVLPFDQATAFNEIVTMFQRADAHNQLAIVIGYIFAHPIHPQLSIHVEQLQKTSNDTADNTIDGFRMVAYQLIVAKCRDMVEGLGGKITTDIISPMPDAMIDLRTLSFAFIAPEPPNESVIS